jgi:porphobilinogen synthase
MEIEVAAVPAELGRVRPVGIAARHHELEQEHTEPENQCGEIDGAHEDDATMHLMLERPRRNRRTPALRAFARETELSPGHLVLPLFVQEGQKNETPIALMPGQSRLSIDLVVEKAREARALGVAGVALFPVIPDELKDPRGSESTNAAGLVPRTVKALKQAVPELVVITDVALDPYSSDGHDGVLIDGRIDNDVTLPILAAMAVTQAKAGADVVAPSDMMDGRVGAVRSALDEHGFTEVAVCSYCVKYASSFYGPFRGALDSAPRSGDKKTYQMDPANVREGAREVALDEAEGADWLMVKPALPYADVIRFVRERTALPVAAYHVSGEYSMLKAAAERGFLDYDACLIESLVCLRRAGASIIFTYAAIDAARLLAK